MPTKSPLPPHPRLYFDEVELAGLRQTRRFGHGAVIWRDLEVDAARHAGSVPPSGWIAAETDDPQYENLYDRFYAMMSDAAIVEQLAFTSAYGESPALTASAERWLLATAHRWRPEAEVAPDYGTAYATTRILKAIAIGYDVLYYNLTTMQREAVRDVLVAGGRRLAQDWFSRDDVSGPVGVAPGLHSPHHSAVEWSSFGIVGLSLLGYVDDAAGWVDRTTRHFVDHLLTATLAADGSHPEGNAFWASTILSQLQFLDPLRRGTGMDLLSTAAGAMDTDIEPARASTASIRPTWSPTSSTVETTPIPAGCGVPTVTRPPSP